MLIKLSINVLVYISNKTNVNMILDFLHPKHVIDNIFNKLYSIRDVAVENVVFIKEQMHNYTVGFIRNKINMFKKYLGIQYETEELSAESRREINNIFKKDANLTLEDETAAYHPDAFLTTPQIIERHGYPVESHTVTTEDGYLLTMHRIPHGKKHKNTSGRPVLIHHGILGSSADWILAGPQNSLAYILADAGYDVWMANSRGNTYSRAHVSLSTKDAKFWNFSWHEIGHYDLPAYIEYINAEKTTTNDIVYIGHSMGTTVLFVLLSTRPEYNHKMHSGYVLAPVVYMNEVRSPVRLLAPIAMKLNVIGTMLGFNMLLPRNGIVRWLSAYGFRRLIQILNTIYENVLFTVTGFVEKEPKNKLMPVIQGHIPAGTSPKSLLHYAQAIKTGGQFQFYDYGHSTNMQLYDSKIPPDYPLDEVILPITFFTAMNDWLCAKKDADKLFKRLKKGITHRVVSLPTFNHLDFLASTHARKLVYEKLVSLITKTVRH